MDQEKVGKLIKELRKKNNLTQKELADKLGVTYQAVSKWETGKNIPDISLLKQLSEEFQIDVQNLLDGEIKQENLKKKHKFIIFSSLGIVIVVILIISLYLFLDKDESFEFKTISARCDNFTISGSIAYNAKKSSIYISHIDYCGGEEDNTYDKITCSLYESSDKIETKLSDYSYDGEEEITLEQFLQDVSFHVDDYQKTCKIYNKNSLHLEIDAVTSLGEEKSYKIPLNLDENCNSTES